MSCRRARAALEEFSFARSALVLVVFDDHLAAAQHRLRVALDLPTLEEAVVAIHVVRLRADRAFLLVIEDDDVGVGADGDRSFAREEAEDLGRGGGGQFDEAIQRDPRCRAARSRRRACARRSPVGRNRELEWLGSSFEMLICPRISRIFTNRN